MCATAFVVAFSALGVRLWDVATDGAARQRRVAAVRDAGVAPEIVDRRGRLLAGGLPMRALVVAGPNVWDPEETAAAIASALPDAGIDARAAAARLAAGRYVTLGDAITPAQEARAFALGLPGVEFADVVRRYYPHGELAAHVVGWRVDGRGGVAGLERALDASASAKTLVASIDLIAQRALERVLAERVRRHRAEAAWGAIMDVATGEIVAFANAPTFDPNDPGAAPADARRNRAAIDLYELGSAFKTFTAAAALEAGVASEFAPYDARGAFRVAGARIRDFHGENRVLTFSEVVQHSSNIGAARMAGDLGSSRQRDALASLGLLSPLRTELAARRAPRPPAKWGPVESATVSYGHGISVTPMHLLNAFAAVVNGGELRVPTFVAGRRAGAAKRVFSEETSAIMRRVLRRVVTDGTASYADVPGYYPVGKTATADKPSRGGYDRNARIASFVGAFPGPAPRYAVLISFDNPKPSKETHGYATAGWNAAPAFAEVVSEVGPALGVTPISSDAARAAFGGPTGEPGDPPTPAFDDDAVDQPNAPVFIDAGVDDVAVLLNAMRGGEAI